MRTRFVVFLESRSVTLPHSSATPVTIMADQLPSTTWQTIFQFVGAHEMPYETWQDWPCCHCKPWWHNWYCQLCNRLVPPAWTCDSHWGQCGQSCGCCRNLNDEDFGSCKACTELWNLKVASSNLRRELRGYNGRGELPATRTSRLEHFRDMMVKQHVWWKMIRIVSGF